VTAVRVQLTRVSGHVQLCTGTRPDDTQLDDVVDDRAGAEPAPGGFALALVAVLGAMLVTGYEMFVIVAALGIAVLALRRVAAATSFSFTDGFLAYRGDPGWPRGVQEDDDFHWSWSPPSAAATGTFQPPRVRSRVG
jgi:hypothetical protein